MNMRLPNTGQNTGGLTPTVNVAASASLPVHRLNTAEPYIFVTDDNPRIFSQGTLKHGKRNMT